MRITALLLSAVLIATLFASVFFVNITSSLGEWDPLFDWDMSGKIDPADFSYFSTIYGATGTPINWTQLFEWMDSLNATVKELQSRVNALEVKLTSVNNTIIDLHAKVESLILYQNSSWATNMASTSNNSWNFIPNMLVDLTLNTSCSVTITLCARWAWNSYNYVRAVIDSDIATPGEVYIEAGVLGNEYQTMSFYMPFVENGSHTIGVQWKVYSTSDLLKMHDRLLIVTAIPVS